MYKKKSGSNFVVDVKIHYQGKVIRLSLARVIRWLVPLLIVIRRIVAHFRDSAQS